MYKYSDDSPMGNYSKLIKVHANAIESRTLHHERPAAAYRHTSFTSPHLLAFHAGRRHEEEDGQRLCA